MAKKRKKDGSEYEPLPNEAAFNADKEKLWSSEYGLAAFHEKYGCYVYPLVAKRIVEFFRKHPKATVREAALALKVSKTYCWQVKRERIDTQVAKRRPKRRDDESMTWVASSRRWTRRVPGPVVQKSEEHVYRTLSGGSMVLRSSSSRTVEDRVWVGIRTLKKEFPELVVDHTRAGTRQAANAWWKLNYERRHHPRELSRSAQHQHSPESFRVWLRSLARMRKKLGAIVTYEEDEQLDQLVGPWINSTDHLLKKALG